MTILSNLPPGVTDRMIEDYFNSAEEDWELKKDGEEQTLEDLLSEAEYREER